VSLRYLGRLFHTIGADAVQERSPYVDSLTGGTTSLLLSDFIALYLMASIAPVNTGQKVDVSELRSLFSYH